MVETGNQIWWFGHVEIRLVDYAVRRLDQMEGSQTARGRRRIYETINKTIEIDLEINELDKSMVFDRTLWCRLIHVVDLVG